MSDNIAHPDVELDRRFVVITRVFDAPRELVFSAWTDPEHLLQWFAPEGCTVHFRELNIQEGGTFHSCIRTPDGFHCWCTGTYLEIVAPERIVYTVGIADETGQRVTSVEAGHDTDWPVETVVKVTFSNQDGKTKLTLEQNVLESLAQRTGAYQGWLQMLDRLAKELDRLKP